MSKNHLPAVTATVIAVILLFSAFFITVQIREAQETRSRAQALTNCNVSANDLAIDSEEQKMFDLVNAHRQQNGIPPLKFSTALNRTAAWLSADMNAHNRLRTTDSLGRSMLPRFRDCGITTGGGEIISSQGTADAAFNRWRAGSASNRFILNSSFKTIGIAHAGIYWTLDVSTIDDNSSISIQPSTVQPSTVQPSTVQPSTVQPSPPIPATACNTLDSTKPIPSGYAASYNVHSTTKELTLEAQCASDQTKITVGKNTPELFVYNKGYKTSGTIWSPIALTCEGESYTNPQGLTWCKGNATATLSPTDIWYAAYTCLKINNIWKCGCTDASCTTPKWQLQGIKPEFRILVP